MIKYHSFKLSDEWRTPLDIFGVVIMKSISPETYKLLKDECDMFADRMEYFKNYTEIPNDPKIFPQLALIATLCRNVADSINE